MAIETMSLVNILGNMEELDMALERCCESGIFHIEPAFSPGEARGRLLNDRNEYAALLKRAVKIAADCGIEPVETDCKGLSADSAGELEAVCSELEKGFDAVSRDSREGDARIEELRQAQKHIKHLKGMNSDFQQLFSCKHVSVRIGRLPLDNYPKLEYYNDNFFFVAFEKSESYSWGMYFCPENNKERVDDMIKNL